MAKEKLLKIEEVAYKLKVSVQTLNIWYAAKRANPDNKILQTLPEYKQAHTRGTRYWTTEDIPKLRKFQKTRPFGRNGIMGIVSQKYKKKEKNNVRKK